MNPFLIFVFASIGVHAGSLAVWAIVQVRRGGLR